MQVAAEADTAVETSTPNAENASVTDDDRRSCNARDDNTLLEVRAGVEVDFIICYYRKAPRIEKCLGCRYLMRKA
jgi:hypothetical protein